MKKQFKCEKCLKSFGNLLSLKRHVVHAHKERPFKCDECRKSFYTQYHFDRHLQHTHSVLKEITCDLCNETLNFVELSNHLVLVHDIHSNSCTDTVKCKLCAKVFKSKQGLRIHEDFVHRGIQHACPECKKVYSTALYLEVHRKSHDPTNKKSLYSCEKCPKEFMIKRNYEYHLRKHEGNEIVHLCDVCGLQVLSVNSLRAHKRTLTGEKPYQCDKCEKRFATKSVLRVHRLVHTNQKPYECEVCKKRFTQKPTLNVHMRSHTGEKPYPCDICQRAFVTRTLLKYHKCNFK